MFTAPKFALEGERPYTETVVRTIEVVALRVPEVPLMVSVAVPRAAKPVAVSVSTLVPVAGFGLKDAVTPLGRPDAARVTLPVKPFRPVTVTVDVPEAP
jgi:hypothetical protein